MRVVPPPEMVAYLAGIGALEQRARAAAVLPPVAATHPAGRVPGRALSGAGALGLGRSIGSVIFMRIEAWMRDSAKGVTALFRGWFHAIASAISLSLLVLVLAPTALQATARDSTDLHGPIGVIAPDTDWRLIGALLVGYSLLGGMLLVHITRSRFGRKCSTAVKRTYERLFCRQHDRDVANQTPKDPEQPPATEHVSTGLPVLAFQSTMSPEDALDPIVSLWFELLDSTLRLHGAMAPPDAAWSTAIRSHRGNVRTRNEDFAIAFSIDKLDVVLAADGCGGVPCGFQASRIASCAGAVDLVRQLATSNQTAVAREKVVYEAFNFAVGQLASAAQAYPQGDEDRSLLQTTLMIALASPDEITFGYIGDGGAVLLRARDGTEVHVLKPMKADGCALNVLAAVLGPQMLGEPRVQTIRRQIGDLLLLGSDGVWDFVPELFAKQVVRELVARGGKTVEALDVVLSALAEHTDELGYVCSDNLTLGIVDVDRSAPKFGEGFWRPRVHPIVRDAPVEKVPLPC